MPDASDAAAQPQAKQKEKNFFTDIPMETPGFHVRGAAHLDWGMKNRLSRIFNPESGRTVMLAFDHGYIMGPTSGIERMDLVIPPLMEHVDCLMCTRGGLRGCIPPTFNKPVCLRSSAGSTILTDLNDEVTMNVEEAVRLNASAMAMMVAVGGKFEASTIKNLSLLVDEATRYGVPVMGVTAVGKELTRDARYLSMATRVIAENGAQVVKTYYCEPDFEQVTSACPVPIVIAGGKKIPERDALELAFNAVSSSKIADIRFMDAAPRWKMVTTHPSAIMGQMSMFR